VRFGRASLLTGALYTRKIFDFFWISWQLPLFELWFAWRALILLLLLVVCACASAVLALTRLLPGIREKSMIFFGFLDNCLLFELYLFMLASVFGCLRVRSAGPSGHASLCKTKFIGFLIKIVIK
jgi:hypothetical protein